MIRRLAAVALASVLFAAGATGQRSDRSAALDRLASEVASQLRCPVCQGLSIQDSPSELSLQMKALVREQLAAGKSPDDVKRYFVEKYGEWVLLEPKASGVNLFVYLVPLFGVLAGGVVVWRAVKRWTAVGATTP